MKYYMSFDGGGTKLQGILFDEESNILAAARTKGVNATVYTPEQIEQHAAECITQLLEQAGRPINHIDRIVSSQNNSIYAEVLQKRVSYDKVLDGGEGTFGVLCCGQTTALCALSGTGSDTFYIRNGECIDVIGGWGYVLGDDGSGAWIGMHGARSMFSYIDGMIEKTLLHEMIEQEFGIADRQTMYNVIYDRSRSAAQIMSGFCPTVNKAAELGDKNALAILREGGRLLAEEAFALISRHSLSDDIPVCTTGSVFRHCHALREHFTKTLKTRYPAIRVLHPVFEPVIGGLIRCMIDRGEALTEENWAVLKKKCSQFLC